MMRLPGGENFSLLMLQICTVSDQYRYSLK